MKLAWKKFPLTKADKARLKAKPIAMVRLADGTEQATTALQWLTLEGIGELPKEHKPTHFALLPKELHDRLHRQAGWLSDKVEAWVEQGRVLKDAAASLQWEIKADHGVNIAPIIPAVTVCAKWGHPDEEQEPTRGFVLGEPDSTKHLLGALLSVVLQDSAPADEASLSPSRVLH